MRPPIDAHLDAMRIPCPDCHAPTGEPCVWADGRPRKTAHLNRHKHTPIVNVDTDTDTTDYTDYTEPIHPPEDIG